MYGFFLLYNRDQEIKGIISKIIGSIQNKLQKKRNYPSCVSNFKIVYVIRVQIFIIACTSRLYAFISTIYLHYRFFPIFRVKRHAGKIFRVIHESYKNQNSEIGKLLTYLVYFYQ